MVSTALTRCVCLLLFLFVFVEECEEYRKLTVTKSTVLALTVPGERIENEKSICSKTVDLIVGGEAAQPGEFPHQALLGYPNEEAPGKIQFKCGGTLISERFVLTAAHCCASGNPTIVRLGEHSLLTNDEDEIDFKVEKFIRHPDHRPPRKYNDIALVKLTEDVIFSKLIHPACLWTGSTFNFSSVIATGFGLTEFGVFEVDVLQKVKLDFLDRSLCDEALDTLRGFSRGTIDSQLCLGSEAGGKDTCEGDSGGPVQINTEPNGCTYHVVGVTSTSLKGCGFGKSPSIYTRVYSYLDWIERTVWGESLRDIIFFPIG